MRDIDTQDLEWLVERTCSHAAGDGPRSSLAGRVVGLYFALTSTRTRTAFATGAMRLGADVMPYGPHDLQLATGESLRDTTVVLSSMLDALVVRTPAKYADLDEFARQDRMPVINAMNADEHPTQALADLATMTQIAGSLQGIRVLYLGEANSTATALAVALSRWKGAYLSLRTPTGYGIPPWVWTAVRDMPGQVHERHDMRELPADVDFVYTTRWQTTGTAKPTPQWRDDFEPFTVDEALMRSYPSARFLHDLPAHRGDEVAAEVIDGPQSVVFRQAANKLYSAMASLEWCILGPS